MEKIIMFQKAIDNTTKNETHVFIMEIMNEIIENTVQQMVIDQRSSGQQNMYVFFYPHCLLFCMLCTKS